MPIRHLPDQLSEFLQLLASDSRDHDRVPSLTELSKELGVSVASLREQMEVARALGFVEVRPKTGIRRLPFSFRPAVEQSLAYAIAVDANYFTLFANFRRHVEAAYWYEAVALLDDQDKRDLRNLITRAQEKLHRTPIQIPQQEHRELHTWIFRRLNNIFVMGILDSYWDLYEAVGLDVYTDLDYLQLVWAYHQKMVEAICSGDLEAGYTALTEHMDLLNQRSKVSPRQLFE
jgi:DNA-binding FadR family transcriptional regulator